MLPTKCTPVKRNDLQIEHVNRRKHLRQSVELGFLVHTNLLLRVEPGQELTRKALSKSIHISESPNPKDQKHPRAYTSHLTHLTGHPTWWIGCVKQGKLLYCSARADHNNMWKHFTCGNSIRHKYIQQFEIWTVMTTKELFRESYFDQKTK